MRCNLQTHFAQLDIPVWKCASIQSLRLILPAVQLLKVWHVMQAEPGDAIGAAPMEIGTRPEALDEQQIESMIHEHVHQKLQVILEGEMADALHEFVDKARICAHVCLSFVHNCHQGFVAANDECHLLV